MNSGLHVLSRVSFKLNSVSVISIFFRMMTCNLFRFLSESSAGYMKQVYRMTQNFTSFLGCGRKLISSTSVRKAKQSGAAQQKAGRRAYMYIGQCGSSEQVCWVFPVNTNSTEYIFRLDPLKSLSCCVDFTSLLFDCYLHIPRWDLCANHLEVTHSLQFLCSSRTVRTLAASR